MKCQLIIRPGTADTAEEAEPLTWLPGSGPPAQTCSAWQGSRSPGAGPALLTRHIQRRYEGSELPTPLFDVALQRYHLCVVKQNHFKCTARQIPKGSLFHLLVLPRFCTHKQCFCVLGFQLYGMVSSSSMESSEFCSIHRTLFFLHTCRSFLFTTA